MSKYDKVIATLPADMIFRPEHKADCLHCAISKAIFDFFDEHHPEKKAVDTDMIIDDVGHVLAEWIAEIASPQKRNGTAEICGRLLKRRVREFREAGNYPGSPDNQGHHPKPH